jgi:hypothetical protein
MHHYILLSATCVTAGVVGRQGVPAARCVCCMIQHFSLQHHAQHSHYCIACCISEVFSL